MMGPSLVCLSAAVINTRIQTNLGNEIIYFLFLVIVIKRTETHAGTWAQTLEKLLMGCFWAHVFSLSVQLRLTCLGMVPPTVPGALTHQLAIKKVSQSLPTGQSDASIFIEGPFPGVFS